MVTDLRNVSFVQNEIIPACAVPGAWPLVQQGPGGHLAREDGSVAPAHLRQQSCGIPQETGRVLSFRINPTFCSALLEFSFVFPQSRSVQVLGDAVKLPEIIFSFKILFCSSGL